MSPRRIPAVATALLLAALAIAGCGLGPGEEVGDVELTVTRGYGAEEVLPASRTEVTESDTVMRVLEAGAEIETRYGGGFVQAIEGLEAEESGSSPSDWFFFVNGVESSVGAADYPLRGGERIWWDYRDWGAAMYVPAVVGSWPQPFADGYEGKARAVEVQCLGKPLPACEEAQERVLAVAADVERRKDGKGAIRVLVGTWDAVRSDPVAAQIERGPESSGVFARLEGAGQGCELDGLDERNRAAVRLGTGAGLVAATRRYGGAPVWVVTGCDAAGVQAAAGLLDAESLRDRYALAVDGDGTAIPLPVPAE